MGHRIDRETAIGATHVDARCRHATRGKTFSNEKNDSEWSLNDPMLEIKNAQAGEGEQAEQRKQLIAPFHERRSECDRFSLSTKEALVAIRLHRQSLTNNGSSYASDPGRLGNQPRRL